MDGKLSENSFDDPLQRAFAVSAAANPDWPKVLHIFPEQAITAESQHICNPPTIGVFPVFITELSHELVENWCRHLRVVPLNARTNLQRMIRHSNVNHRVESHRTVGGLNSRRAGELI